jgi:hypothetical protein
MMHFDGTKIMMDCLCKRTIETQITYHPAINTKNEKLFGYLQKIYNNPRRMYKIIKRGYDINVLFKHNLFKIFNYDKCKTAHNCHLSERDKLIKEKTIWINENETEINALNVKNISSSLNASMMIYSSLRFAYPIINFEEEICKERYTNHIKFTKKINYDEKATCIVT